MAILSSCCCWKSLRKACHACAIYSFVYYVFLIISVLDYLKNLEQALQEKNVKHPSVLMPDAYGSSSWIINLLQTVLVLSGVGSITSVLLIIGIWKDKKLLLLPWIMDAPLILLLDFIYVGYLAYEERMSPKPEVAMILTLDFFLLILNCYALLCVISQFQEYKAGRGRSVDERPPGGISSRMNSCETDRKNTIIYESKSQPNGISPKQSRKSYRNPSIKISKVDRNYVDENKSVHPQSNDSRLPKSEDLIMNFSIHSDCLGSTPATSSTSAASETSIRRSDSKKKVQFPPANNEIISSFSTTVTTTDQVTNETTECELSTGRDWNQEKSLDDSPLILLSNINIKEQQHPS